MLSAEDHRVALQLKKRLQQVTPLLDMRVYGSRARGDAIPESDLDVYVELEHVTPALRDQISVMAWEVGFDADCVISTFVVTQSQLEQGALGANPIIRAIEQEGIPIR